MVQLCLLNKLGELNVLLASFIFHLQYLFIFFLLNKVVSNVNKNQAGINITQKKNELAPSSPPQFNN